MVFDLFNEKHVLNSDFQYTGGQRSATSASCDKKSTLLIILISYSRTGVLIVHYPQGGINIGSLGAFKKASLKILQCTMM